MAEAIAILLFLTIAGGLYVFIRWAQNQAEKMENQDYEENMKKRLKKIKTY